MNVFYNENGLQGIRGISIALGVFDGVHLAHYEILHACVQYAHENGLRSFAYTYSNQSLLRLKAGAQPLSTQEERLHAIAAIGIENVIVMDFDEAYAATEPQAFLEQLCGQAPVRAVFCGFDYRFGHRGKGDVQMLLDNQEKYGYRVMVTPAFRLQGEVVSSSHIRQALAKGDVRKAHAQLGRPYALQVQLHEENGQLFAKHRDGKALPKRGSYTCALICQEGVYTQLHCHVGEQGIRLPALAVQPQQIATILWIS